MKRSLFIANERKLKAHLGALVIQGEDQSARVPFEDIGYVIIEHPQTSITQGALNQLSKAGAVVYICDEKHLPSAYILPLYGHTESTLRTQKQLLCSEPLRKSLWQQLVKSKLENQASVLYKLGKDTAGLKLCVAAERVVPGDTDNKEAYGAAVYWKHLLASGRVRDPDAGDLLNARLNYGYAVLRGAVARAIVASGLLPGLGLHHKNKYNPFCLADDLMEPYRPFIDLAVLQKEVEERETLSTADKLDLVALLTSSVSLNNQESVLMNAVQKTAASLALAFLGERRKLLLPAF
jgi:CRISPR-associated protein Cas1